MNRSRILTSVDYSEQLANNLDQLDKHANKIDTDQISSRQTNELSSSSKMVKVSFMAEVCTELAITKNLAITDTFLCHDEGDVILSTFGFYSPSDAKHAAGVNLLCSALDGLSDYNRTAGYQNIYVKDLTLSMLVATTGSKMSSTLQMMHQKKENLGILGRLNIWHLQSLNEFVPPRHSKLVSDIASIDHLFIIAHEIYQHNPEFRFKKHATDTVTQVVIDDVDNDEYMKSLRLKQGIDGQNEPILSSNDDDTNDVFNVCSNDLTDDGGVISAYKLMLSILDSYFKTAQQMDRHSSGCVPKGLSKFPRACSLLYLLEIISGIASNLLKYISFDEGNFSRPHSKSKKFISMEFVHAARQHVKIYLLNLPSINNRPITYIDKSQVERAHIFYSYVETTMNMLFDASFINYTSQIDRETTSVNYLSKTMVHGGLLKSDNYLSITKSVSYVKLPPSTLRQNEDLLKLFNKFGPSFTLNSYEKMFEKFGLVTAADATIVPITFKGIVLLREDNAFVNFYHCLDKDEGVLKMIQERITSKEINLVHDYKDGPYRYELVIENEKIVNISSNDSNENNNENIKNGILTTDVNSSIVHNSMINVNQHFNTQAIQEQDILSMLSTQDNNMLLSATNVHPQSTNQIQRHNCGVSSASSDSRVSVSSVSPSFDHANFMQSTPRASSPIPAMLFQSLLNIDENSTASNIQFDNLSSIIDEPTSSPTNAAFNTSSIMIRLHSPIPEPARLVQQTLSPKSANDNMDLTSVTSHETYQENNLSTHQTNDEAQKRFSSQSVIPSPVSSNFHSQTYRVLSQLSDAIQLESNTNECVSSNTSVMQSSSMEKQKRGRRSNVNESTDLSSTDDAESILFNHNHPVYKRLILLDGIVFSKTDFSHALQQFPNLRDNAIEKLCKEGVFIKGDVFAKKTSTGIIEHLQRYVKRSPAIDGNGSLNVEDYINFGNILAKYEISIEEYINSFNNAQSFMENSGGATVKRILNRSNIKLASYLFSMKFVEFISQNNYFSERFAIDNDAICFDKPYILPTTSNIVTDAYQKSQYRQARQHKTSKKRAYSHIQDNSGAPRKSSRRRP
ncbi:unnamed protein product [Rotaria socialis]|uniref:Uncharacterized protein n=2 Tax=Rotaria socialis TaxID=392032 RepID=A0A820SZ94_9BILA|nr:unnamed protein product [Rotaria socialis]